MMLHFLDNDRPTPSQFRFCNMWLQDDQFPEILRTALASDIAGTKMYQLVSFLKCLKKPLRALNRSKFKNIHQTTEVLRVQLDQIQSQLHLCPTDALLQQQEKQVRKDYLTGLSSSLQLMHQ